MLKKSTFGLLDMHQEICILRHIIFFFIYILFSCFLLNTIINKVLFFFASSFFSTLLLLLFLIQLELYDNFCMIYFFFLVITAAAADLNSHAKESRQTTTTTIIIIIIIVGIICFLLLFPLYISNKHLSQITFTIGDENLVFHPKQRWRHRQIANKHSRAAKATYAYVCTCTSLLRRCNCWRFSSFSLRNSIY